MEEPNERFVNFYPASGSSLEQKVDADETLVQERSETDAHQIEPSTVLVDIPPGLTYEQYESELQMPDIIRLMKTSLSEPYSIYTYRYFIHNWPRLCKLAKCDDKYVGAIVCKLEMHHFNARRGYIAMLAVDKEYRKRKIGMHIVKVYNLLSSENFNDGN